jgi:hypothetical protein
LRHTFVSSGFGDLTKRGDRDNQEQARCIVPASTIVSTNRVRAAELIADANCIPGRLASPVAV